MKIYAYALVLIWLFLMPAKVFSEGEVRDLKDFEYWDNGKLKACTMYDADGHLKAKAYCRPDGTVEKVEKYDLGGNKVEEAFYDEKGKLKAGIDGWAAMRWWYNGLQLMSQVAYNEEGRPVERKLYGESGKLVLRQYLDNDSVPPYEDASMAMMLGGANMKYQDANDKVHDVADTIKK